MYWDTVLKEVLNKKNIAYPCVFTHLRKASDSIEAEFLGSVKSLKSEDLRVYLGQSYPQVYFTQRETQCILLLLKGYTMRQVAIFLKLSARTVEYYTKNMKRKLQCRTKSELIGKVLDSEFMQQVQRLQKAGLNRSQLEPMD